MNKGERLSRYLQGKNTLGPSMNPFDCIENGTGESIVFHRIDKSRGFHNFAIREWEKTEGRLMILFAGLSVTITGDDQIISRMHSLLQSVKLRGVRERAGVFIEYSDDQTDGK